MQAVYPSLASAVESGPAASYITDYRAAPSGGPQMAETLCPPGLVPYSSRPEYTLTCTLRAEKPGGLKGRIATRQYRLGDFQLAPPCAGDIWSSDGTAHFLNLAISAEDVETLLPRASGCFEGLHDAPFRCPTLNALFDQLWLSLAPDAEHSRLLSEGLYRAIVGQLSLLAGRTTNTLSVPRLDTCVMGKIDEAIMECGTQKLSSRDLAELAGMSQSTFARRFKETTGQSVHQYVLDKRLERAKGLLRRPKAVLAQVAYEAGFASQSHMTDLFRKRLGTTPASYRKSLN